MLEQLQKKGKPQTKIILLEIIMQQQLKIKIILKWEQYSTR